MQIYSKYLFVQNFFGKLHPVRESFVRIYCQSVYSGKEGVGADTPAERLSGTVRVPERKPEARNALPSCSGRSSLR